MNQKSEYELVFTPSPDGHTPCQNCIFNARELKNPIQHGSSSMCVISILEFRSIKNPQEFGKMNAYSCKGTKNIVSLSHRITEQVVDPKDIVKHYRDTFNEKL